MSIRAVYVTLKRTERKGLVAWRWWSQVTGTRDAQTTTSCPTAPTHWLGPPGMLPGEETFTTAELGMAPYPFGAKTYGATAGEGSLVGTAEAPEFHVYSSAGELERIVRWPDHDRTVSGPFLSGWTDFVEDWLASMPAGDRRAIREVLEAMPPAEQFPAYDGIIATESGEVWVGSYAGQLTMMFTPLNVRVPARRWLVFSDEGELTASVETPEGFEPYAVHEGRVWGVFTDEYDIESIRAYEVLKW